MKKQANPCSGPAHDLLKAAQTNDVAAIQRALKDGAIVRVGCGCFPGAEPIWAAAWHFNLEAVQALIKAGAEPNIKDELGVSLLQRVACAGSVPIAVALLEAGADPHAVGPEGNGALHTAYSGQMARLLLDWGVHVDANAKEQTPLQAAAWLGNLEVVKVLVEAGADLEAGLNDWATPYDQASGEGHDEVADYLLAIAEGRELEQETELVGSGENTARKRL